MSRESSESLGAIGSLSLAMGSEVTGGLLREEQILVARVWSGAEPLENGSTLIRRSCRSADGHWGHTIPGVSLRSTPWLPDGLPPEGSLQTHFL